MKKPIHTIDEYQAISADVWQIFKKYFPDNTDNCDEVAADIHKLDTKYKKDVRQYCFMQKLLRVYYEELDELWRIKGVSNGENG